ncbi:hypothetical protein SARC_03056 [Sphaeroforma arctica JP610]|uniref:Uncharacterized protein n=1 Tax=Sphaeroforma arctica JP610 TaxID=667725 RepID=A0A0L0G749_9EUKA|nr:hypothetical protein SARC_03056 [Sphaeroforma arctica JP610]KNC84744.1 hypothetical protein SARC_03056 [Sphaeroforma arctica JP610]|eukprot:XP_014158646.1 hypothetical protein SARC_03056 [Sphaeroforma arctica JP610]
MLTSHREATAPSAFEQVLDNVWCTIGTMQYECFNSDIIDVLEALESIFLVDNIASYTHVMNIAQEPGTNYRIELYSLMARAIARIRHSVLHTETNVYDFDHITNAQLNPSDVLTYLQRARLFYSARMGFTEGSTTGPKVAGRTTALTKQNYHREINYKALECCLRESCASEDLVHEVEALPELCNLDPALTAMPVSRVPSRVDQKFY